MLNLIALGSRVGGHCSPLNDRFVCTRLTLSCVFGRQSLAEQTMSTRKQFNFFVYVMKYGHQALLVPY